MSQQSDVSLANQGFADFRAELNNILAAFNTNHSGSSRPSSAVAGSFWLDTTSATAPILKHFDGAQDITVMTFNYTANTVDLEDSSVTGSTEAVLTTRGDIIIRNSSNATARLAVGAANRALVSDGTDVAYGQIDTAHIANNAIDETKLKDALVADFTKVTVATGDSFLLGDADGSGNTKRDTVQGILDLAPKLSADQAWTGSQRGTPTTDNDGSFDMDAANNFNWSPSGSDTLEFTNEESGQGGMIYLSNGSGHSISLGSEIDADADCASTLSAAGQYIIGYYCRDGTNVCVTYSADLA